MYAPIIKWICPVNILAFAHSRIHDSQREGVSASWIEVKQTGKEFDKIILKQLDKEEEEKIWTEQGNPA